MHNPTRIKENLMQLTIEQCDAQIAQIQQQIPQLQGQLQQLIGYKQALVETEEQPEEEAAEVVEGDE